MPNSDATRTNGSKAHSAVTPPNRVMVALPFSKVEIREPSDDVAELSSIVVDLLQVMEGFAPVAYVQRLRQRAQEVASRAK